MDNRNILNKRTADVAEELKGLLAVIKGHFEPDMKLKNAEHTYALLKDALGLVWDICDLTSGQLTDREKEVVQLMIQGLTNIEIAERLFIEDKSVKFHITNIFKKMNVKNRTQLVVEYYRNELAKTRRDNSILQEKLEGISDGNNRGRDELPGGSIS